MLKEVLTLDSARYIQDASQGAEIPREVIKENADIFTDFLFQVLIIQSEYLPFPRALNIQIQYQNIRNTTKT